MATGGADDDGYVREALGETAKEVVVAVRRWRRAVLAAVPTALAAAAAAVVLVYAFHAWQYRAAACAAYEAQGCAELSYRTGGGGDRMHARAVTHCAQDHRDCHRWLLPTGWALFAQDYLVPLRASTWELIGELLAPAAILVAVTSVLKFLGVPGITPLQWVASAFYYMGSTDASSGGAGSRGE